MSPKGWLAVARWSLLALAGELFFGFGLAFNPGWANGWPFGLTIHSVFSAGMSLLLFLILVTAAALIGAIVGAACSYFGAGLRRGRAVYAGWLVCCCVLALVASLWAFREIYASTLEMWPNGYNPRAGPDANLALQMASR
jgi:hypothetical protein